MTVSDPNVPDKYDVHIRPNPDHSNCPRCMRKAQSRGKRPLKKRDYVMDNGELSFIFVRLYRRKFFCRECDSFAKVIGNKTISPNFSEELPIYKDFPDSKVLIYNEERKVSTRLARYIYFLFSCGKTLDSIQKTTGLAFYSVSNACKDSRLLALSYEESPLPESVLIKEIEEIGHVCTLICDVHKHTVVFFAEEPAEKILDPKYIRHLKGKPMSVEAEEAEKKRKARLQETLSNARTVTVDSDCRFLSSLKAHLNDRCTIFTDLEELYRRLFARFEAAARRYRSLQTVNFMAYTSTDFSHRFFNQEEYNIIRPALNRSPDLKTAFSALNTLRNVLGVGTVGDEYMSMDELTAYLQSCGLLSQELSGYLFDPLNREMNYTFKEYRDFVEYLSGELKKIPKKHSPESVEGTFYFCVPRCYADTSKMYANDRWKSVSCFEGAPQPSEQYRYIGKTFDSIKANLRYREEVMAGSRTYSGPDII